MSEWLGKQLGQYEITAEIGRGGMAVVYKAWQPALNRPVAIKVLPTLYASDHEFVTRFKREAMSAAQLKHPHIVTIYDVGQEGDTHFIVMEYLEGPSLYKLLRATGPLPLERAAHIGGQVASALDFAHRRGLVHRDIKPANIIVGQDDHATLTDFGIAKAMAGTGLTQTGAMIGTPQYMAPEQIQGLPVDQRADVYALGIVCYEMLAGAPPFTGDTAAVLYAQAHKPPPPLRQHLPGLPAAIERALERALAKDPELRFGSAGELALALAATQPTAPAAPAPTISAAPSQTAFPTVSVTPQPTPPPSMAPHRRSFARRQGLWLGGGVAAALILAAVLAIAIFSGGSPSAGPAPTPTRAVSGATVAPDRPTASATVKAVESTPPTSLPTATLVSLSRTTPPPAPIETPAGPSPTTAQPPPPPAPPLRLAFVIGSPGAGDIYVVDADGSNQRRLVGGSSDYAEPDWSPDGQRVAYQSNQAGNYDLWVIDADGGNAQQLTTTGVDEREPDWSPDGRRIVYRRGGEPNGDGELWVMDADGKNQRRLGGLILGRSPVWSPDGSQIAFMSEEEDGWEIYVLELSTNTLRRFSFCEAQCRFPNWSPDGRYIVYHKTQDASSFTPLQIWRQRVSGSDSAELLVEGGEPGRAAWSAEGRIAYNTADGIETILANGADRRILRNGEDGWAPDWSH